MPFNISLFDNIIAAVKDKNHPKPHSWKEHLLPIYRKAAKVRDTFKSGMWNRRKRATYRKEHVHKDPRGQNANWNEQRFDVSYPGMGGVKGVLSSSAKMHISDRHPECFPKDAFDTMKNPDKVTLGYDGGPNADKTDLSNVRVNLYKKVDTHKDGTPCLMKVPAKPIKSKNGVLHLHGRTGFSVKHDNNPHETPLDMEKIHAAADHNKRNSSRG